MKTAIEEMIHSTNEKKDREILMREGPHYLTAYDQMTDEQLCVQAKEGDQDAEELLVRRYQRLVRCLARPYYLVGGDNDDLIQEGMIGLIFAVRKYDAESASFHTFAEHCIRNRLYSALRAAARGKHTPLNQSVPLEEPFAENPISLYSSAMSQTDPEDLLIGRENVQELLNGVRQQLSPFETIIFECYLEGMTMGEMTEAVSRPQKSVDNALQRIRRKATRYLDSAAG